MTKYFHRENGEAVIPEMDEPIRKEFGNLAHDPLTCHCYACHDWTVSLTEWQQHIASLPVSAYCSPSLPIGFLPECKEGYQIYYGNGEWIDTSKRYYNDATPNNRRLFLVPVSAAKPEQAVSDRNLTLVEVMDIDNLKNKKREKETKSVDSLLSGKDANQNPSSAAKQEEEKDEKDKEIERLRGLVKDAHYAGWYNGLVNAYKHQFSWEEFSKSHNL